MRGVRALTAIREWSPRRRVAFAVVLQVLWLCALLGAVLGLELPLTVPVAIALWAGPALGGILGVWMGSKSSPG